MPMQFSCNDIRLTILCVSAVLFLSFFNRLLTIKISVLFSIMYSWFPFIHFLSIYFFTFLDFLDSSSRPSFPIFEQFYLLPPTFTVSCPLDLLSLFHLLPFFYLKCSSFENSFPLNHRKTVALFHFSTFFPLSLSLCLSVPQWSFPVYLSVWPTPSWASLASMWSGGPRTRGW